MRDLVSDPGEQLTGREIRSLTARAAAARSGSGASEILTTAAYAAVSVAVAAGLVVGVADAVRDVVARPSVVEGATSTLSLDAVRILLWVAVAGLAAGLAGRLGPAGVSGAGVRWWVPTAVDRTGLLVRSWWLTLGAWVTGTSCAATLVGVVTGIEPTPGRLGSVALLGAACGAVVVSTVGLLQAHGHGERARLGGDGVVVAVPVLGASVIALAPASPAAATVAPEPPSASVLLVVVLLACACAAVLAVVWRRSLGLLTAAVLSARVGAGDRVGAAALSLDTRELSRALGHGRSARARRPSRRLSAARGPASALLVAETLGLVRAPGVLLGLLALACAALVAQQVPSLGHGAGLVVVAAVVGLRAAQAGARGASEADVVPALDSLLPLGSRSTRALRTVLPAAASSLVLLAALAPVVDGADAPSAWVGLLVLAGVGFGAAAVRGAYRRPPDWSAPLLSTPAGALPTGVVASATHGPDLALLVVVPLGVALALGSVPWPCLVVQAVVAAVAVAVATSAPRSG